MFYLVAEMLGDFDLDIMCQVNRTELTQSLLLALA